MLSRIRLLFCCVLCLSMFSACSLIGGGGQSVSNRERKAAESSHHIAKKIVRRTLLEALSREDLTQRLRVVEMVGGGSTTEAPTYRLFEIRPGSVYELLGLKDGDVLVAANERVVANPNVFKQYVNLLGHETSATIEIRREVNPIVFDYTFVEN